MTDSEAERAGHYAKKQIFCRDRLIAWSHASRYQLAKRLVAPYAGRRLLDYGCGDATFLASVASTFPGAVGADLDRGQIADCAKRLASKDLRFVHTSELEAPEHVGAYDVVTIMEVLEHIVEDGLEPLLASLRRAMAPGATLVVSVPIETGLSLLGKQVVRRIAGWRKLGDYAHAERYSTGELVQMLLAGPDTRIERPVYGGGDGPSFTGHKGFNWRALESRLRGAFTVRETRFSPLDWTRGHLSSQAWFVCGLER